MVKKDAEFPPFAIRHRGIFSYAKLLKCVHTWCEENDYEFHEIKVKYKIPSPAGAEVEGDLIGERNITDYLKYKLTMTYHIWDMRDVEIVEDGQKKKVQEGTVVIEVRAEYTLDYAERFKGKFLEELQKFYHKFIIKRVIDDWYEDNLLIKMMDLNETIKRTLQYEEYRG